MSRLTGVVRKLLGLGGGVLDQAVCSLSNLVVSVLLARLSDTTQFGAFGITFAVYMGTLLVGRALVGDLLLISPRLQPARAAAARAADLREQHGGLITAVCTGAALGLLLVALGAGLAGALGPALAYGLVVLGLCLPLLLLQDAVRYFGFAAGEPRIALLSDTSWLLGFGLGYAALAATGTAGYRSVLACWAITGAASGLWALAISPRLGSSGLRNWLAADRTLRSSLLGDYSLMALVQYGTPLIIGGTLGTAAVAGVRGGQVLLGPISVVSMGLLLVTIPIANRREAVRPGTGLGVLAASGLATAALYPAVAAVLLLLPDALGTAVLDRSWQATSQVLPVYALVLAGGSLGYAAVTMLRLLNRSRTGLQVRLMSAPVLLLAIYLGGRLGGIEGAVWGWWLAGLLPIGGYWMLMLRARRQAQVEFDAGAEAGRGDAGQVGGRHALA